MPRVSRLEARVGADRLAVRVVAPPAGVACRGTVLVPPLIGGSGLQQVGYFRALGERGYRLATFDYRGHGKSGGSFSIRSSLDDARAALACVRAELGAEPLHGLGDCYGCIPLLRAAAAEPAAFRALALFSPVPSLQHVAGPGELLADWMLPRDARGRRRPAWRSPLDLGGMVLATSARLFPDVDQSREHFGILRYERVRAWRALAEYLFARPLAELSCALPARVWFGRSDHLLRLEEPGAEERYGAFWRARLPRAELCVLAAIDHYWAGHWEEASALAADFFDAHAAPYRDPGEASGRNHQPGGLTTSRGLKALSSR